MHQMYSANTNSLKLAGRAVVLTIAFLCSGLGINQALAQCTVAPTSCPTCATVNTPVFFTSQAETCQGVGDGELVFFNVSDPTWVGPITFEWHAGTDCSGVPLQTGTKATSGLFEPSVPLGQDTLSGLDGGDVYTVVVFDGLGTQITSLTLTVNSPNIPPNQPIITPAAVNLCPGDVQTLTATQGGGGEAWDTSDSLRWYVNGVQMAGPNAALTNATFDVNGPGDVYVTVDNGAGCVNTSDTITVTENQMMVDTTLTDLLCNGDPQGAILVTVTGGNSPFTYDWSNGNNTANPTGLGAGTYTVTVTDAAGCDTTQTYTLTEPPALDTTFNVTEPTCYNSCDGTVIVTTTGGTTPYTFAWSGGSTTNIQGAVCAGALALTITDANNCELIANLNINAPDTLEIDTAFTDVTCSGTCDATITATPAGGTGPFTFTWSNGFNESGVAASTASALCPGTYTVTVEDANGCQGTAQETVADAVPLVCSEVHTDPTCDGLTDGTIDITVMGGNPNYTYAWSDGPSTSPNRTNLGAATYTVTVTDASNCTCTSTITLSAPPAGTATLATTDPDCASGATGDITATINGGTPTYTFTWSSGQSTQNLTNVAAGTYLNG